MFAKMKICLIENKDVDLFTGFCISEVATCGGGSRKVKGRLRWVLLGVAKTARRHCTHHCAMEELGRILSWEGTAQPVSPDPRAYNARKIL